MQELLSSEYGRWRQALKNWNIVSLAFTWLRGLLGTQLLKVGLTIICIFCLLLILEKY
jgi:hypothetical protein